MPDAVPPSSSPSTSPSPVAKPSTSAPVAPGNTASASSPVGSDAKAPVSTAPNSKFADKSEGAPATETPAEKKARLLKLKVDGQEEEIDLDAWSARPDEEIARDLQMAKAARKRLQEAAEYRKQLEAAIERGKQNPAEALKELYGIDLDQYAEGRLKERFDKLMEEQQLTEEQRTLKKEREEKAALQKQLEEFQTKEKQRVQAELEAKVQAETEKTFMEALESEGLEKSYETLYEMARIARINLEHGIELTPQQLAAEVKSRAEASKSVLEAKMRSGLKGEQLLKYLGDDTVKAVIQAALEKSKPQASFLKKPATPEADESGDEADEGNKARRKLNSIQEFRKMLRD